MALKIFLVIPRQWSWVLAAMDRQSVFRDDTWVECDHKQDQLLNNSRSRHTKMDVGACFFNSTAAIILKFAANITI